MISRKINDKNAESIGRPILDKAIRLLGESEHTQFLEYFSNLRGFENQGKFTEAAGYLEHLGDRRSVVYLDHLIKPDWNLLLWIVKGQDSGKALMLWMELIEEKGDIRLTKLFFKNLYEDAAGDSVQDAESGYLNDVNSESIGRPFIEKILTSFVTSDFKLHCQSLPETSTGNLQERKELFDEAVGVLKPMGDMISFHYVARAKRSNLHTLFWKVHYQKEDQDLLFNLTLSDNDGEVEVYGLGFDK